nr:MAG TPA: hypothetical protein [Caudoviricetes sp.]
MGFWACTLPDFAGRAFFYCESSPSDRNKCDTDTKYPVRAGTLEGNFAGRKNLQFVHNSVNSGFIDFCRKIRYDTVKEAERKERKAA